MLNFQTVHNWTRRTMTCHDVSDVCPCFGLAWTRQLQAIWSSRGCLSHRCVRWAKWIRCGLRRSWRTLKIAEDIFLALKFMGHQFGCRGNTSYGATTDDEPAALMFTTKDTKDSEKKRYKKRFEMHRRLQTLRQHVLLCTDEARKLKRSLETSAGRFLSCDPSFSAAFCSCQLEWRKTTEGLELRTASCQFQSGVKVSNLRARHIREWTWCYSSAISN